MALSSIHRLTPQIANTIEPTKLLCKHIPSDNRQDEDTRFMLELIVAR